MFKSIISVVLFFLFLSQTGCSYSDSGINVKLPKIPLELRTAIKRTDGEDLVLGNYFPPPKDGEPGFSVDFGRHPLGDTAREFAELKKLGHVQRLSIDVAPDQIEALTEFKDLQVLHFGFSAKDQIVDCSAIERLEHLKELSVAPDRFAAPKEVKLVCPDGIRFYFAHNAPIKSLRESIGNCKDLEIIDASFNQELQDVSVIADLPKLRELKISQNPLTEACKEGLEFSLEKLFVVECVEIEGLRGSTDYLVLAGNRTLKSLDGIDSINVKKLQIYFCEQLEDIEALKKSQSLEAVEFLKCELNGKPVKPADLEELQKLKPKLEIKITNR